MKHAIYLNDDMEKKLKAYRERRRIERDGKVMQVASAIQEIIESALNAEQSTSDLPCYADLVRRVEALEKARYESDGEET